nr:hypothetical protein [Corynebacterium sp. CNJ-954]
METGKDADLVVLDPSGPQNTPVLRNRVDGAETLEEILFATMVLGDERAVARTVVAGV